MGRADRRGLPPPLRPPVQAIGIPLRRPPSVTLLFALLAVLLLAGCTGDSGPKVALGALPAPSPPPPPPPVVVPVAGNVEVTIDDTSWHRQLGVADDGEPAKGSVEAATQAVAASLNGFLDSAQVGAPDLALLRGKWLRDTDPEAAAALETGLTNPDNPVAAAKYLMQVQLEPNPTLVATTVRVRRHDDTLVTVEMVFDVAGEHPTLHLVGAAEAQ